MHDFFSGSAIPEQQLNAIDHISRGRHAIVINDRHRLARLEDSHWRTRIIGVYTTIGKGWLNWLRSWRRSRGHARRDASSRPVQDEVLFTFDDQNAGSPNPQPIVRQPNHIRAIFDGRWKFARYFDPSGAEPPQYELYDRQSDPDEMQNLAGQNTTKQAEMASKLAALEAERLAPVQLHRSYLSLIKR